MFATQSVDQPELARWANDLGIRGYSGTIEIGSTDMTKQAPNIYGPPGDGTSPYWTLDVVQVGDGGAFIAWIYDVAVEAVPDEGQWQAYLVGTNGDYSATIGGLGSLNQAGVVNTVVSTGMAMYASTADPVFWAGSPVAPGAIQIALSKSGAVALPDTGVLKYGLGVVLL